MSRLRVFIVGLLAMAGVGVVFAIDDATLRIAHVDGAGFQVRDIVADVQLTSDGLRLHARIGEVSLRGGAQRLRDLHIECPLLSLDAERMVCKQAAIAGTLPMLGEQRLSADIDYGRRDGSLRLSVRGLRLGGGEAHATVALLGDRWNVVANLQKAQLQPLLQLARAVDATLPAITGTGIASLDVAADGGNAVALTIERAQLAGEFRELTLGNETGTLASDKLQLGLEATLQHHAGDWRFDANVKSASGQAYAEPVFLDFGVHAFAASARGQWKQGGALLLDRFSIDHTDVLRAQGAGELVPAAEQPVQRLQLELQRLKFPGAYESYLQPFLVNTSFKSMQTAGSLVGKVTVDDGVPRAADLQFDSLSFDDGARTVVLRDLSGPVHWRDDEDEDRTGAEPSQLRFAGGVLLGLELGASQFDFVTNGRGLHLLRPAHIPLFDGAIELESFRARNVATPKVAFMVDATIRPISVAQLCRAFGWPEFGGQVGGAISKLRMREGVVTLGTTLEASVFDGSLKLSDLRLEDALGQWPKFYANVGFEKLDLELLTRAFSFGRITGRVSGAVRELRLFNWTPVGFDAALYTPADDRSKHRISQRAVENIGSLGGGGGGVTAALSSGFLRFFEDFNYDRLGMSCKLQNEVCIMNGVAPAPHGSYYLVKGKGVPRIDVIASARRVDWPRLLSQLKAATESSGPSVQ